MSLLKPIDIGPLRIASPVILAPMTGVTDLPFRKVVKRYGAGLTVSEMIASQAIRSSRSRSRCGTRLKNRCRSSLRDASPR